MCAHSYNQSAEASMIDVDGKNKWKSSYKRLIEQKFRINLYPQDYTEPNFTKFNNVLYSTSHMDLHIVLDNISSIRRDTEYISEILYSHIPKLTGSRAMVSRPSVKITQSERDKIVEISKSIVIRVSEIVNELNGDDRNQHTNQPIQWSQQLYNVSLALNQEQFPDDGELFEPLGNLVKSINGLERFVKTTDASNPDKESSKKYSNSQVDSIFKEVEKNRIKTRLKAYRKLDPKLEKISENLKTDNSNILDIAVNKILYLSGFDTEIYDPGLAGNIDVIALDTRKEIVCICENTTGKISKTKVDQLVGRIKEYKNEYQSWKNVKICPVLISTNDSIFSDNLAKRNAIQNGIHVLSKKELIEILKNVEKGKETTSLLVKFIKKKIPK